MNLKFTSSREKFPSHESEILYMKAGERLFGFYSIKPTFTVVYWRWKDKDGNSICFNEEIDEKPKGYQYLTIIDENE